MATNEVLNLMSTTCDETNKENAPPQPSSSSTPIAVAVGNLEAHPETNNNNDGITMHTIAHKNLK